MRGFESHRMHFLFYWHRAVCRASDFFIFSFLDVYWPLFDRRRHDWMSWMIDWFIHSFIDSFVIRCIRATSLVFPVLIPTFSFIHIYHHWNFANLYLHCTLYRWVLLTERYPDCPFRCFKILLPDLLLRAVTMIQKVSNPTYVIVWRDYASETGDGIRTKTRNGTAGEEWESRHRRRRRVASKRSDSSCAYRNILWC